MQNIIGIPPAKAFKDNFHQVENAPMCVFFSFILNRMLLTFSFSCFLFYLFVGVCF